MIKRLKRAWHAFFSNEGLTMKQMEELTNTTLANSISQTYGIGIPMSSNSNGKSKVTPGFCHHTFDLLNQVFHNYSQIGEVALARNVIDRQHSMIMDDILAREEAERRAEIEAATGPANGDVQSKEVRL